MKVLQCIILHWSTTSYFQPCVEECCIIFYDQNMGYAYQCMGINGYRDIGNTRFDLLDRYCHKLMHSDTICYLSGTCETDDQDYMHTSTLTTLSNTGDACHLSLLGTGVFDWFHYVP